MTKTKPANSNIEQSERNKNQHQSDFTLYFILLILILLIGVLVQQNGSLFKQYESTANEKSSIDIDQVLKDLSVNLKKEILDAVQENQKQEFKKLEIRLTKNFMSKQINEKVQKEDSKKDVKKSNENPPEDSIVIKADKLSESISGPQTIKLKENEQDGYNKIGKDLIEDPAEIKLNKPGGESIRIDSQTIKAKGETVTKEKKKRDSLNEKQIQSAKESPDDNQQKSGADKNFKSRKISKVKPKKMWIPIPNSNGGHRRCPAIEVQPDKEHGSSVKIWLYEEFFSQEECENLIKVHESHVEEMKKHKPIICFESIETLRKNLVELNREEFSKKVSSSDFTEGTFCLNQTFSRQLEKWGLKWSYSTAFYPGESKFSAAFGKRIQEATQLEETHGGKFQVTSYPFEVGYKSHLDCVLSPDGKPDRYATFLVYLNDMGADNGGETLFTELGVDVKPREGRALVWNNMNYETEKCEAKSVHQAAKIKHVTKKKYIIQRWYYLENFEALGKRTPEARLPRRGPNTPKVSCDDYDNGSCRMYDEWNPDHMIEYRNQMDLKG